MVVDNVENHRESALVTRVHNPLQGNRTAVGILNGKGEHAVVTPVSCAGKLRDRHDFHSSYSDIDQIIKVAKGSLECAFGSERPGV